MADATQIGEMLVTAKKIETGKKGVTIIHRVKQGKPKIS